MSWDVILLKEKFDLNDSDYQLTPLGNNAEIGAMLTKLLPHFKYHSDGWSVLNDDEFSIEFNMSDEEIIDSIMLHIRGGGDPMAVIKTICDATNWAALDTSTSEFMDTENLSQESWIEFQKYRDKVIKRDEEKDESQ